MNRAQRRAAAKRQRTSNTSRLRKVLFSSGALLGAGAAVVPAVPAAAATYEVTDPGDGVNGEGGLTLREAVEAANANPGPDTITFAGDVNSILLTEGDIGITDDIRIYDAEGDVTVDAQGNSRIFYSGTGELGGGADVTIEGLSLINGDADQDDDDAVVGDDLARQQGGAISMYGGSLSLIDVTISNSHADEGGAIGVEGTGLSIADSTLEGNSADYDGGAIFATDVSGDAFITGTTIADNTVGDYEYQPASGEYGYPGYVAADSDFVGYDGGGVWFSSADSDLTITGSIISGNDTPQGGGGVFFYASGYVEGEGPVGTGSLLVADSTIDGNRAGYFAEYDATYSGSAAGGGIAAFSQLGTVSVTGGTISDNHAFTYEGEGKYSGTGGGLFTVADTTITGVTIVDNRAGKYGGGIATFGYGEGGAGETSLTISGGEISGNLASGGAGVSAAGVGDLTLQSTQITGNQATLDSWFGNFGGGGVSVKYLRGAMSVDDTTISGNAAGGSGGRHRRAPVGGAA